MTITEQLAAALGKIKLCASPMDRTFDKMIQDMDWILAEARYALAAYEASEKSRPRIGGVEMTITEQLAEALRVLAFMARTSGGTAGRDDGLCAACDKAEDVITAYEASKATPTAPLLWCCHVRGPDDVHPAPDYQTALKWSDMINDWSYEANARFEDGEKVMSKAAPALWPWSPESHAQNLAKAIADFSPRGSLRRGSKTSTNPLDSPAGRGPLE